MAAIQANRRSTPERLAQMTTSLAGVVLFLLSWELVSRFGLVDVRYLPAASTVAWQLLAYFGTAGFWIDVGHTMSSWAIGLAIATLAACLSGFVIGASPFLRRSTHSSIEFLRPIPSVALIPLAVLLFGTKMGSSLLLIVYASFWQVLLQVLYGVADVDAVANDTAKSYRLGRLARIRHVVWPTALPYLMTGIRLAAAVALILAITAELVIGSPGLGKQIALTESGGAIVEMYALIVAAGLLGVLINVVMRTIERRLLGWHPSVRSEAPV
jgi:ABC-type nitrate/sulfonate/bicarbonate transport system permease component